MTEKVSVALVGIPSAEKGYFDQVVRFSKSRQRAYELWGGSSEMPVDLVVTDDEAFALERARALVKGSSSAQLVVVSNRGSSSRSPHLLTRPLLISRVLRVLDQASADIPASPPNSERNPVTAPGEDRKLDQASLVTPAETEGPGNVERRAPAAESAPVSERIPGGASSLAPMPEAAPKTEWDAAGNFRGRRPQPVRLPPGPPAEVKELERPGPEETAVRAWAHATRQRPAAAERERVLERAPGRTNADTPRFPPRPKRDTVSFIGRSREPTQIPAVSPAEAKGPPKWLRQDTVEPAQARAAAHRPLAVEAAPLPEAPQEVAKTAFKALVVDDSLAIRKQLEIELGEAGIAADYAETGERALEMAAGANFDLVFLDIMMPGIDGYEVCKTLRKAPEHKKTPIIMLSGKTSPLDEVQGVLAGATTYLTKPVDHAAFQTVLGRVVKWLDDYRPVH